MESKITGHVLRRWEAKLSKLHPTSNEYRILSERIRVARFARKGEYVDAVRFAQVRKTAYQAVVTQVPLIPVDTVPSAKAIREARLNDRPSHSHKMRWHPVYQAEPLTAVHYRNDQPCSPSQADPVDAVRIENRSVRSMVYEVNADSRMLGDRYDQAGDHYRVI